MSYDTTPLRNLVDPNRGVSYGIIQPGSHNVNGIPIIRVNNLVDNGIRTDDLLLVGKDVSEKYKRSMLHGGELLVSLVGTVGRCVIAPESVKGWNVARAIGIVPLKPEVNKHWVKYYIQSLDGQEYIRNRLNTTVQATFNLRDLSEMPIPTPGRKVQDSIAATLSCLDDKIELNTRIIANLEAQAQAIFKSWFVDFEPFQDGEFEDSELGMIPKGWKVGTIGEIAHITSGKRPVDKAEEKTETCAFPIIGASQIMGYTTQVLYNSKIIVTGRVGTHGIIQRFSEPCWPSDNTLVIKSEYYEFAYNCLSGIDYKSLNRGSTQPLITQTDIKNTTVIIPPVGILLEFEDSLSSLLELVRVKHEESDKLKLTRDTLLPKLMSGEIEVPVEG